MMGMLNPYLNSLFGATTPVAADPVAVDIVT